MIITQKLFKTTSIFLNKRQLTTRCSFLESRRHQLHSLSIDLSPKNFRHLVRYLEIYSIFHPVILFGSEDEHGLIAQYCQSLSSSDAPFPVPKSPLQIMASVDADQKDELEQMIR